MIPLLCLAAGLSVAFTVREQARREKELHRGPYLPGLLCFVGLVVVPLASVLLYQSPGWSLLYFLDPEAANVWMALAFLAALPVLAAGGFWGGVLLCRGGWAWLTAGLAGLFFVAGVASLVVFGDRVGVVAAGLDLEKAQPFFSTPLPAVLAFATPLLLGGWIFLLVFFEVEGKKIRQAILLREMPAEPLLPAGATSSYPSKAGSFERLLQPGATAEGSVAAPAKAPSAPGGDAKG